MVNISKLCQLQQLPSEVRAAVAGKAEDNGSGGWKEVVVEGQFVCIKMPCYGSAHQYLLEVTQLANQRFWP